MARPSKRDIIRESAESSSEVVRDMMRSSGDSAVRRDTPEIPPIRRGGADELDADVSSVGAGGAVRWASRINCVGV